MFLLIAHIAVAQAATVINVIIAFLHTGLERYRPKTPRIPWPVLLCTETVHGTDIRVAGFSYLSAATTLLVAIAGIVMPLGLSFGPMLQAPVPSFPRPLFRILRHWDLRRPRGKTTPPILSPGATSTAPIRPPSATSTAQSAPPSIPPLRQSVQHPTAREKDTGEGVVPTL
ncbi:hypothetical protein DFH09DRAFT_1366039 [Mycena vulgaris]|nr:hypothetical protein DFH09DRAFT_1366039 [Mycena vulgaris]